MHVLIYLVSHLVPVRSVLGEMPTRTCCAMFPWKSLTRKFQVRKVVTESDSPYPCSVLIEAQAEKSSLHNLWLCIPLSLSPPYQPLLSLSEPFSWMANSDHSVIIVSTDAGVIRVYRRQTKGFQWKLVREFLDTGMTARTQWDSTSMGAGRGQREVVFGYTPQVVVSIEQVGKTSEFHFQTLKTDFWRYGTSEAYLSADGTHLSLSFGRFRQTDGVVDFYKLNLMSPMLDWQYSVVAPHRASAFGHRAFTMKDRLIVSAPFAPGPIIGSGAVYIYELHTKPPLLIQTLNCPEGISGNSQKHLQFGWFLTLSDNGVFLVTSARTLDSDRLYVYQYSDRQKRYRYIKTHHLTRSRESAEHFPTRGTLLRCTVTNHGHLITFDDARVHWLASSRPNSP